jgi:competence protein ComEC
MRGYVFGAVIFVILYLLRIGQIGGLEAPRRFSTDSIPLESFTEHLLPVRNALQTKINLLLTTDQASLLSGILLGLKEELSPDLKKALIDTSTIHIAVVSGQNLTLVAGFVLGLASLLGRKRAVAMAFLVSILYAFLAGLQVPVLRALVMVTFSSLASLFGRERDGVWVLLLTGALMLLYNPNWLFSISFQLSFLATVGVVILAPMLVEYFSSVPELLREDLSVSLSAQLLTLPVIAINFHQMSLLGVIANLLILWIISPLVILSAGVLLVSFLSLTLAKLLIIIPAILLQYLIYVVMFFDGIPYVSLQLPNTSLFLWIGYYLVLLGLYLSLKHYIEYASVKRNEYAKL